MSKRSVNYVIRNTKGKYLLQMRDGNEGICHPLMWNCFGGKIEKNENVLEAAIREIKEELGINVSKNDFSPIVEHTFDDAGCVCFLRYEKAVTWDEFTLREGAGVGFFTRDEICKIDSTLATKWLANNHLS